MFSKLIYYIFYASAIMIYGIGLSKATFESRNSTNTLSRFLKGILVVSSTSILTWLFSIGVLVPHDLAELFPFFCIFIFIIISVFSEVLLRLTAKVNTSDFSISLLCTILAVEESSNVLDSIFISILCLSSFFLYTGLLKVIRKRMELSTSVKEIDGRGLLLVGMAVIALSMIAWNVTWLNPGVIK